MDDFSVKPNKPVGMGRLKFTVDAVARQYQAFWFSLFHAAP
jgi:hypothetical protein